MTLPLEECGYAKSDGIPPPTCSLLSVLTEVGLEAQVQEQVQVASDKMLE